MFIVFIVSLFLSRHSFAYAFGFFLPVILRFVEATSLAAGRIAPRFRLRLFVSAVISPLMPPRLRR